MAAAAAAFKPSRAMAFSFSYHPGLRRSLLEGARGGSDRYERHDAAAAQKARAGPTGTTGAAATTAAGKGLARQEVSQRGNVAQRRAGLCHERDQGRELAGRLQLSTQAVGILLAVGHLLAERTAHAALLGDDAAHAAIHRLDRVRIDADLLADARQGSLQLLLGHRGAGAARPRRIGALPRCRPDRWRGPPARRSCLPIFGVFAIVRSLGPLARPFGIGVVLRDIGVFRLLVHGATPPSPSAVAGLAVGGVFSAGRQDLISPRGARMRPGGAPASGGGLCGGRRSEPD